VVVTDGIDGPRADAAQAAYRESLRAPLWWYVVAVAIAALFGAEFHIGGLPLTDWIPYLVLVPLAIGIVWSLGRGRVEVREGELRIRDAHLPLNFVSGVIALDRATLRLVVGREGDPAAFVSVRPWIGPGVQVWLDDPDDPAPYWVVSSRRPDELVRAVRAAL
jgi:hypothetical protein